MEQTIPHAATGPIALVGIGSMGRGIAQCLLRGGHELHAYARRAEAAAPLAQLGAVAAATPAALGKCRLAILSLPDADAVRDVLFGPQGLADALSPGSVVVDTSTIAATDAREIGQRLGSRGVHMLDAPVSGGQQGAEQGTLGCMVGGEAEVLDSVRHVLSVFCKSITHAGGPGAGQTVKACNQVAVTGAMLGMIDALALARAQGVDPAVMRDVLLGGTARSFVLEHRAPKMIAGDFAPGFRARLMRKDLRIALDTAQAAGVTLGAARMAERMLDGMCEAGDGDLDWSALARARTGAA
ncbi:NAD(P)-dependent oxidoreductase [Ramlibacter sp.]|uniref:NAD(P)-dependent oxidoreductase n=1 Tax=Ramlibacter sp. TaxID=1917967 RepID=UPI003D0B705A